MAGRTKQEVAVVEPAAVPDLIRTPALDLDASDITLPRIHIGQHMSKPVMNDLVGKGELFSSIGQEDPAPVTLDRPARFHVLAVRKGKSFTAGSGAPLERYDFDDPSAPAGAWVTYDYTVMLPDVDREVPFKLLLTRSGMAAAKQMNMIMMRYASTGPQWQLAFELDTQKRENEKGQYWVAKITQVEAKPEDASLAGELALMISDAQADRVIADADEPTI